MQENSSKKLSESPFGKSSAQPGINDFSRLNSDLLEMDSIIPIIKKPLPKRKDQPKTTDPTSEMKEKPENKVSNKN